MRRLRILGLQILLGVVFFEVCLQVYNPLPFRVRGDRIVLPVYGRATYQNSGPRLDPVVYHRRNSLGFRGPEPPRHLETRLSIITIGGSTTECRLLTDGKTWPDVLAARLAPAIPTIWVNNAGFDGHSTHGHLIMLRQVVVALRPTVALFLVGANDIGDPEARREDISLVPRVTPLRRMMNAAIAHVELFGIAQNLYRYNRARQQGVGHAWTSIDIAQPMVMSDAAIEAKVREQLPIVEGFRRRLEEIVNVCREAGIEPVFITQPALYPAVDVYTGKDTSTLQVSERGNGALDWRLTELNNEATRDLATRHGLFLIDLARDMPHDSRLYYDFIHFTNEGAAAVGEIVAGDLGPYLRERFVDGLRSGSGQGNR